MSIDEISQRLALPKTTIYGWVSDPPLARPRSSAGQAKGAAAMQAKYSALRQQPYECGRVEFPQLQEVPGFRDFVVLYIAEGYKRRRNIVEISNSDPAVIQVSHPWMRRYAGNPLNYSIQYHVDQDLDELRDFWSQLLGLEPTQIRLQRKSNSRQLARRSWRSVHGVLAIRAADTMFRSRLQAWMDVVRTGWTVD